MMTTNPRQGSIFGRNASFIGGVLAFLLALTGIVRAGDDVTTPAGTVISNRAEATYTDASGNTYSTVSGTIRVTVLAVPSIVVAPDETAPSDVVAANERIQRNFRICNSGNIADLFLPQRATISAPSQISRILFDLDASGTITDADAPVTLGQTLTPRINPGECLGVIFDVETGALGVGSRLEIRFQARSTLRQPNGSEPDDGGIIVNAVGEGARFSAADDTTQVPALLVNDQKRAVVATGQTLRYKLLFRNAGAVVARSVVALDELPDDLSYVPNTLRFNGRLLTDAADGDEGRASQRRIELRLASLNPAGIVQLEFSARLSDDVVRGRGIATHAALTAENAATAESTEAVAVVDPTGIAFAGNSGGATRVSGVRLTLSNDAGGTAFALDPAYGVAPNAANANPFDAGSDGTFNFGLAPTQLGSNGSPARYILLATAANFRSRKIEVLVTPASAGRFSARLASLDDQALATPGGFALTNEPVVLNDLAALVFNIPLFELSTLSVSKTADKQFAEIGDVVTYRIQVRNASVSPLTSVAVRDTLPAGFVFAAGTAALDDGRSVAATVVNGNLEFPLGTLAAGASASFSYRVRIGASAADGEQYNIATARGVQPNGESTSTSPARAAVRVGGGAFSMTQVLIGRVFDDRNRNGRLDEGERAFEGVRVYLDNGRSVVTDSAGQYSLPAVNAGSFVIALDPTTLPDGFVLLDDAGRKSSQSWTRLVRTPLGGGTLVRQNFALGSSQVSSNADANAVTTPVSQARKSLWPPSPDVQEPKKSSPTPGTYTVASNESIAPVTPGDVVLVTPRGGDVLMSPALNIDARVANGWTIVAEVNGQRIASTNLAQTRIDNRNRVTEFSFVGIVVRPGENRLRLTAIGANGERGKSTEATVIGRGPAERVEIVSKTDDNAAVRTVSLTITARDRLGNPAADGQVMIQTTAGRLQISGAAAEANASSLTTSLKDGAARVLLIGDGGISSARVKVVAGGAETATDVRFAAELRPTILVGVAELAVGQNAPEIANTNDDRSWRSRLAFFYRGRFFGDGLLTLSYDSNRALNRFGGRDRFGMQDPLERAYPVFGDSSQRFEDAPSNSKLYARYDRGLSYAMFGDMDADMSDSSLAGYNRKLTGVKLHLERTNGDFLSLTGARPDTAFARDVFPGGGLSVARLSHFDILPGSEVIVLETRDRRAPDVIVRRETLIRSVDYNLDPQTGELFFMRPISAFDFELNLIQVTAVYEYRADGSSNYVFTGRARKNFDGFGIRIGASYVDQRQEALGAFRLGGIDLEKILWNGGRLSFEAAMSNGRFASGVNVFDFYNDGTAGFTETDANRAHNGLALALKLDQPLPFRSRFRFDFAQAAAGFYNPFGGSVTPGGRRINANLEFRPSGRRSLSFGFMREDNRTRNVDNSRLTVSALWSEQWRDNLRTTIGFDHRQLDDNLSGRRTSSNLFSAALEFRPTKRLEIQAKREQNLSDADPTYPDQTTFAIRYELDQNTKIFLTQRLASAPITPIGDFSTAGFASTRARNETAFGIETRISGIGAFNGRYQLENGINGTDSFAVVGLQNRWKLSNSFSIEAGAERGFLLRGLGESFNSATAGVTWTPVDDFRALLRYELRDRNGLGHMLTAGAVGRIGGDWTTEARGQWAESRYAGRRNYSTNINAAAAYRPLRSDAYALLFSYNRREMFQAGDSGSRVSSADTRDRYDTLSTDALIAPFANVEIYGRFAARFAGNGNNSTTYASAFTMLGQLRAQQRLGSFFDVAGETRWLMQPSSSTMRRSVGAEFGFWALPDLRFGVGYGFKQRDYGRDFSAELRNSERLRRGVYFTLTTKLSNIFNLFGTPKTGLVSADPEISAPTRIADAAPVQENDEERREDER